MPCMGTTRGRQTPESGCIGRLCRITVNYGKVRGCSALRVLRIQGSGTTLLTPLTSCRLDPTPLRLGQDTQWCGPRTADVQPTHLMSSCMCPLRHEIDVVQMLEGERYEYRSPVPVKRHHVIRCWWPLDGQVVFQTLIIDMQKCNEPNV